MGIIDPEWMAKHAAFLKAPKKKVISKGYPAEPGTGPEGETCGTCGNLCGKHMSRIYYKCLIMKGHWTCGGGTDVKVRSAACSYWKPKMAREDKPAKTEAISLYVR